VQLTLNDFVELVPALLALQQGRQEQRGRRMMSVERLREGREGVTVEQMTADEFSCMRALSASR
jgi:hypothetical protein